MKNFSVIPTDENALALLQKDPVGRNLSVFRFIKLIDSVDGNCSIALNGEWGSGKTMFIKQVKLLMDYHNPQSRFPEELRSYVEQFKDVPCYDSYSTVYFDAWENDKYEDPLLSLIYAAICETKESVDISNNPDFKKMLASIVDVVAGRSISDIFKQAQGDDLLKDIKRSSDIGLLIHDFLDALIRERGNRLVIFVDELDRCRPIYAVQLLERIKHFFNDERITFVFSVNLVQLQHTIKSYYGASFDATRYLDKFFDLRIAMPAVDYDRFFEYRFPAIKSDDIYDKMCIRVIQYFSFSLREIERYVQMMRIAAYNSTHPQKEPFHRSGYALLFAMSYFVPIMVGLSMVDLDAYQDFMAGKNFEILRHIFSNMNDLMRYDLLGLPNKDAPAGTSTKEAALKGIIDIYEKLFLYDNANDWRDLQIGKMSFSKKTRQAIMEIASLLSPDADYEIEI